MNYDNFMKQDQEATGVCYVVLLLFFMVKHHELIACLCIFEGKKWDEHLMKPRKNGIARKNTQRFPSWQPD